MFMKHAITPLRDPACRTRSLINEIAKKAGVHIDQMYRWLKCVRFDKFCT